MSVQYHQKGTKDVEAYVPFAISKTEYGWILLRLVKPVLQGVSYGVVWCSVMAYVAVDL